MTYETAENYESGSEALEDDPLQLPEPDNTNRIVHQPWHDDPASSEAQEKSTSPGRGNSRGRSGGWRPREFMRPFQMKGMKLRESELPISVLFNEEFDKIERVDDRSRLKIRPVAFMLFPDHA